MNTFEWDSEQTTEKLRIIQNSQIFIKQFYFLQNMDRIKILVIDCQTTFQSIFLSTAKKCLWGNMQTLLDSKIVEDYF